MDEQRAPDADPAGPGAEPLRCDIILAAHGEAQTAGFFENWRVGHRTLAHSAQVMRLPAPLRWVICTLGALRKRLARAPGSPHNARTRAQAAALAAKLEGQLGRPVSVRAAFASSEPSVEALIERPGAAQRRIFLSMMPSDSRLACGLICHALVRAGARSGPTQVLARLWDDPEFIRVNAAHVRASCSTWPDPAESEVSKTALLLALHGTLVRDPRGRVPAFHAGLAEKLAFAGALQAALSDRPDWPWAEVMPAYLNHDVAGTWSQPTVAAALEQLAQRGFERVWVFPCDFPVEGAEVNRTLKTALATGPVAETRLLSCLNDSPAFIDYLAARVQRALAEPASSWHCDACPLADSAAPLQA